MSPFERGVVDAVRSIPHGVVLSYGQVAARAGNPRAARAVARVLRQEMDLPWWRVVRADGTLAGAVAKEQAKRLRAEGVRVKGMRLATKPRARPG